MNAIFLNTSNYQSESKSDGRPCKLIKVIANPEDTSHIDAESMPQFLIEFLDNGEQHTAYPDEIDQAHWLPEMKACLEGLSDQPLSCSSHQMHWEFGQKLKAYR